MSIGDHCHLLSRPFSSKPSLSDWFVFCEELVSLSAQYQCFIIDTISAVAPWESENDSAAVTDTLQALQGISAKGAAVIITHHPAKAAAGSGAQFAARGSGAFLAAVDDLAVLSKPEDSVTQRHLHCLGRSPGLADHIVLDYDPIEETYRGLSGPQTESRRLQRIYDILRGSASPLSPSDILLNWPWDQIHEQPSRKVLLRDLHLGSHQNLWRKEGDLWNGK